MEVLLKLFITFLKIGAFSFGGGYAMLPLIENEIVQNHNWLDSIEFIDILAVSEMTPGSIAINSATFLGFKVAGVPGSVISTIGVVLPSFVVISIIFLFLNKFKNSKYIDWIFMGIRPVVLGLIASAAVSVAKSAFVDMKAIMIAGIIFYLVSLKKLNPIFAIIIAGGLGLIFYPGVVI